MKIVDLFAGVGGLSLGFSMAGFEPVLAIEKDKDIANSYRKNHNTKEVWNRDIQEIDIEKELAHLKGKVIGVIGGPPCQGFSQKGKRLHIEDKRNYLFQFFIKVVAFLEPKFFVMENVPNILSANNSYFKDEIITTFKKLNYDIKSEILNASDYNVPQNRRRAFFIGIKNSNNISFPEPLIKKVSIKEAIYDLPFISSGEGKEGVDYRTQTSNEYQKIMRGKSKKVFNHISTNHSELALEKLSLIPKGKGKEVLPEKYLTKSIFSGTWSRLDEDSQSVTITTRFDTPSSGRFTHPILDRCLTVREAARIQSFPDDFIFYGSKSNQMLQVGNAVPPLLAYHIAKQIKKGLNNE
jgi:DNA (cytosine-5)-methyltransferase 1